MRVVVTGATGGIGERISLRLAEAGHSVVLVGRAWERIDGARRRIAGAVPGADLGGEVADLSLAAEVRALAERLEPLPDVVINNAAVIAPLDASTSEGRQLMLATNHLAPYVLLRILAERLGDRPARFVIVGAHPGGLRRTPVDLDDLECRNHRALGPVPSFRPFVGYGRTKNMNAMFGYALAARLAKTKITVNGGHPGIVDQTGLGRSSTGLLRLFTVMINPFTQSLDEGADNPYWLATAPEVAGVTGKYYLRRRAVPTADHTTDPARVERLWDESARLVGLPADVS
ncbi:SDR family NAD(P)-dependent oxidoreductase [Microlunatus parietis]|uniref:NAD(P)-dependent dehydrogenase (Short-subunit alcohol dehydrogenase family) n=1 Tax=Microlunatus parietis TaxID=682979 RepID=A0A7Y9I2I5_9ACTN|nr:SDR family NAD(P)-dependent oxidoreductase [Microlunatus parietis]NYE69050.1 NAD(P)-dependent dehydrogenase (short-subunit alcohol dehydrogenase family) [Microlunatus parietis]